MTQQFDVIVIGGGLAGMTAALALARAGHRIAAVTPPGAPDSRTTALLMPSVALLERLGLAAILKSDAAPLRTMRLVDGSRRLVRAPTVSFHAGEIGEDCFGYNIANATLVEALAAALDNEPNATVFSMPAGAVDPASDPATVTLGDGQAIAGGLIVAADGRNSLTRQAAGIAARQWRYPQSAIVLTFRHQFPHEDISTEFHTETGPFTQVPMQGERSSLVWVETPEMAERILAMDADALNREIESRMQSMLGRIEVEGRPQRFPLSAMVAEKAGSGVVALVGEAAHAFAPIGAQGLNLGLRDVAELTSTPLDLSSRATVENTVDRYSRGRWADIRTRSRAVDLLNRSLLSDALPVHLARAAGLALLSMPNPLRSAAISEGMMPGSALRVIGGELRDFSRGLFRERDPAAGRRR